MKRIALLILLASVVGIAPVKVQTPLDPTGAYRCDGVSPDGQTYRAAVEIVRNGDTFIVRWLTPRGVVNVGVGVLNGTTLSVGYVGASAGVVVYKLDGNKQLSGEWTDIEASGHLYTETLTRLGDGEKVVMPPPNRPVF
ncbi:MAG: hypothetical protein EHM55_08645 [Acidobacteria bacterium]|nr:MAG: hypothetical protein EHM55_08645 [Acidobacteriota bacterium]